MHRLVKSVRVKTTFPEAVRFADEVSRYLKSKYSPETLRAYVSSFGDVNSIFWEVECRDSASIEALNAGFLTDRRYLSMLGEMDKTGSSVQGSVQDATSGIRSLKEAMGQGGGPVSALARAGGTITAYWISDQVHMAAIGEYSKVESTMAGTATLARAG